MNTFHALILGIVEGITEFLPISSTAHLEMTSRLLSLESTPFLKTFQIVIQLGAILAVVFIYASWLRRSTELWKRIIIAFVPTGIIGFVLYKIIKNFLLGNTSILVWTLGIGGILLIIFELKHRSRDREPQLSANEELEHMPYATALIIGLVQSLAVVPGVSRSAATIIAGRSMGLSRQAVVEFSFLLAIPTMLAASSYDLLKEGGSFSVDEYKLLAIGFIVACLSALVAIKTFLKFVRTHNMIGFGIYRIVIALILFFILY